MKTDFNKVIFADSQEELQQIMTEEQSKAKGKDCPAVVLKSKLEQRKAFEERCKSFEERLLEEQEKQKQKLQDMIWGTGKPTYSQVIEAGFKREIASDDVFEEQHGYPYFLVNYEAENFIIEWDVLSHELTLTVADQLIGRITFDKAREIIEHCSNPKQD
jgi:hypothetical protein